MTQKQLISLIYKHRLYVNPKMPKKDIMLFIMAGLNGENDNWEQVSLEYKSLTIAAERDKKLKALGI